jgi:hypothetical protein
MNKETVAQFIVGSTEVQEILMVNRQRLRALVLAGKLTPFKELKRESLFWKPDVEMLKDELALDPRSNLFKAMSKEINLCEER